MNEITQYQLALEVVNATDEQLAEWAEYVVIDDINYGENMEEWDTIYYWDPTTPEEVSKLNAQDVIMEHWRR